MKAKWRSGRSAIAIGLCALITTSGCSGADPEVLADSNETLFAEENQPSLQAFLDCFEPATGANVTSVEGGSENFPILELVVDAEFDSGLAEDALRNECRQQFQEMALNFGVGFETYLDYFSDLIQNALGGPPLVADLRTPSAPCLLEPLSQSFDFSSASGTEFDYYIERPDFEWGDPPVERFAPGDTSQLALKTEGTRDYGQISKNGELLYVKPLLEAEACYKEIRIDISFRATPFMEGSSFTDGCRTLLNTNGSRRDELGLSIFLCQGSDEWPETFLTFWTSNGNQDPWNAVEGYQRIYSKFNEFGWNDVSIQYRFGLDKPRIEVTINGSLYNILLVEGKRANPESIRSFLTSPDFGLWLGGHPDDDYLDHPADLELDIDHLSISYGSREQNSAELANILGDISDTNLESLQERLVAEFLKGFNYQWDEDLGPAVLAFVTQSENRDPLFSLTLKTGQNQMPPVSRLTYILKQWILDDLSASETGLLRFQESTSFPGDVSASAIREQVTVEVNGTYKTDPNFVMGGQATVLRSTGRYVPPGESVSIRVPESATGHGLNARVGIHWADLERNYFEFNRFPRISRAFPLDSTEVNIDNPLGGALYIEVEDGTDLGMLEIQVSGAVEMPTYSRKGFEGINADLSHFQESISKANVPWFEIVGESFALTYPIGMAHNYLDPRGLLDVWESALADISIMAGRPIERFREEWIAMDSMPITDEVPWPVDNPSFGFFTELADFQEGRADSVYDRIEAQGFWNPNHLLTVDEDFLRNSSVMVFWHEWGHMQNLPTAGYDAGICQEVESNVHLLAAVVYNRTLGLDIDKSLRYSGFQDYDMVDAALDTMFSPSWQSDERMCFDEWDNEMRYQTRSWARLVEIAGLYGWEAVGKIHKVFYDLGTADMDDQDTIALGSKAVNVNLAPIFEFWGVPAEPATLKAVSDLPPATEFIERLELYRANVPETRNEFSSVIKKLRKTTGAEGRWDFYEGNYDPELADLMITKINRILKMIG